MCAHYTYNKDEAKMTLREKIEVFGMVPRAHIRLTDLGPVIIPEFEGHLCQEMNWGWKVAWDKSPLINAKSETVSTLTTFRQHLDNRCLLLADGFYEKSVLFRRAGGDVFCLAGLWREEKGSRHYVMLTTEPNATVAPYHNRMPLIVRPELYDAWLGEKWKQVIAEPDHSPLDKFQKQPELF